MNQDKFTIKAREAINSAVAGASSAGHPEVTPLHLLSALLEAGDGIVPSVLFRLEAPVESCAGGCRRPWKGCPGQPEQPALRLPGDSTGSCRTRRRLREG